jgi:hypothetical protein
MPSPLRKLLFSSIITLSFFFFSLRVNAEGTKLDMGSLIRSGATYGEGTASLPSAVKELRSLQSFVAEADIMAPLSLHLGYRETMTQRLTMTYGDGHDENAEMYCTMMEIGVKMFLPFAVLQPWGGAGYLGGNISINRPRLRDNHGGGVIYARELEGLWGSYWHAGLDIMISPRAGLRAYYQKDTFETDQFRDFNNARMGGVLSRWQVGIVGGF